MLKQRIIIADDHLVVRQGLRDILGQRSDLEVVAEASDGVMAEQLVRATLAELQWPGRDAHGQRLLLNPQREGPRALTVVGVIDALQYAIDNNVAPVISISYGGCEALNQADAAPLESWVQQANLQGETVIAAAAKATRRYSAHHARRADRTGTA